MKFQRSVKCLALLFLVGLPGCDDPDCPEDPAAEEAQQYPLPEQGADEILAPSDPVGEGHSQQSRNGLTCKNDWYNTLGRTKCTGTKGVKWRLKVACAWQGDYTGPWQTGPGSDGFECNISVQNASVIWG